MRDFCGFRFGNVHSEDLHLVVVSSSNRYDKNLLPDLKDYTSNIPGGDGEYYFGQTFEKRTFSVKVAFDSVSEPDFRRIAQIFSTDKLQDLVFDELPYKTYRAKLKQKPDFKFVCFEDRDTKERIYKGEGSLEFICYQPYAYGFNKYIVRAADYYRCLPPEHIIDTLEHADRYIGEKPKIIKGLIKDHYNVKDNMNTPWKGGYPTIEQVQAGELYFDSPDGKKMLIDVRGYWDNIPQWQSTAKLLTSPTLDYDQELIYAPQYSQINYYNMDTGLNHSNGIIGSRILVYNPGDIPVDFELKLGNLSSEFRKNLKDYSFRVSRYNVQRLTIEQAVDWTGLKTYRKEDDDKFKYGTRYFHIIENNSEDSYKPEFKNLKDCHPNHAYIVEPIPQEKLGYFIRLFYWQSSKMEGPNIIDFEDGLRCADRYEELYKLCISDDERNELYWKTLKEVILEKYKELSEYITEFSALHPYQFLFNSYTFDDFCYSYIHNPPEYARKYIENDYGEFIFNLSHFPDYYTYDYFEISNKDFDKIQNGQLGSEVQRSAIKPLYLDTEGRMLYNISRPEYKRDIDWLEENPNKIKNFYDFKTTKNLMNENIEKGHWFKIPPGWSMIDISPIIDSQTWGGKTWLDARPFDWGMDDNKKKIFDKVYYAAAKQYAYSNCPSKILELNNIERDEVLLITSNKKELLDELIQFRKWPDYSEDGSDWSQFFENQKNFNVEEKYLNSILSIGYDVYKKRQEQWEYGFLKMLAEYWRIYPFNNTEFKGDIDDWWWYANSYIWANFPPLYWGYADLLNQLQIKYTPLFY